jgi:hypothetical protein
MFCSGPWSEHVCVPSSLWGGGTGSASGGCFHHVRVHLTRSAPQKGLYHQFPPFCLLLVDYHGHVVASIILHLRLVRYRHLLWCSHVLNAAIFCLETSSSLFSSFFFAAHINGIFVRSHHVIVFRIATASFIKCWNFIQCPNELKSREFSYNIFENAQ